MTDLNRSDEANRPGERNQPANPNVPGATGGAEASGVTGFTEWGREETYWRDNFSSRPYARGDRGFDVFRPAYRYGTESANRLRGRKWSDVEPELRSGWERYEHRGASHSAWADIKDAVRDAWDRVAGRERAPEETRRNDSDRTSR
jgi:hypothetical protein